MVNIAAWPTAAMAYLILLRNIGQFLHRSAGWLTCLIGSVVVRMIPWPDAISALLVVATLVCVVAGSAAFCVGWCRTILMDELSYGAISWALGKRELRCLAYLGGIALIPATPAALLFLLFAADTWWSSAFSPLLGGPIHPLDILRPLASLALLLPMIVVGVAVAARLLITVPAVAIDEPGKLARQVWRHSAANGRPLVFGWLVTVLPVIVLWEILWVALDGALGSLATPIVELIAYPCYFVALALTGGFFCHVYAQLVDGVPVAEGDASPIDAVPAA